MAAVLRRDSAPEQFLINKQTPSEGIVHIGLGNFHRAHFAFYTAQATARHGGDWGICAYSLRNTQLVDTLRNQENLYSILEIGPDTDRAYIPNIHTEFVVGYEQALYISEKISKPEVKIVSLTVTEAGYYLNPSTSTLNLDHPDIQNDLAGKSPRTIYGLIAHGLANRDGRPITILSCDNMSHNGDTTKKLFLEFLSHFNSALISYLNTSVSFPNSMVDRIVPGTEAKHVTLSLERLGVEDQAPVPCEKFTMWALEDNFIAGRPQWEDVIFTEEVDKFEVMKLRLLNGAHSLLAYLGGAMNCPTIPDCKNIPAIEKVLHHALYEEYLPSVDMPSSISANAYISQLYSRWSNTVLGDRTSRVGSDGSTKLPQRITVPALALIMNGRGPKALALTLAAWLCCIAPFADEVQSNVASEMKDPNKELLNELVAKHPTTNDFIQAFFALDILDGQLREATLFKDLVLGYRESIRSHGMQATLDSFFN